jgi:hypothetical protein
MMDKITRRKRLKKQIQREKNQTSFLSEIPQKLRITYTWSDSGDLTNSSLLYRTNEFNGSFD